MAEQKKEQTKKRTSKKTKQEPAFSGLVTLFKDKRFHFIIGIFILLFAVYICISFFSFLFNWKQDQAFIDKGLLELISSNAIVKNTGGKIGVILAHHFIQSWFGIASISIIFLIGLIGLRLMQLNILPFGKIARYLILGTIWVSIAMGFFFDDHSRILGGAHGQIMSEWLNSFLGKLGTFLLLLVTLFAFIIFAFENSLHWMRDKGLLLLSTKIKLPEYILRYIPKKTETPVSTEASVRQPQAAQPQPAKKHNLFDDDDDFIEETVSPAPNIEFRTANQTVIKKEYTLGKNGKEVSNLGFEVENTKTNKEPSRTFANDIRIDDSISSTRLPGEEEIPVVKQQLNAVDINTDEPIILDDDGLTLRVEKNQDIQVDEGSITYSTLPPYDPTLDLSHYKFPTLDLLTEHKSPNSEVSNEELISNKNKIIETLSHFKIEITKIKALIGPTITLYEIIPAPGVRISKIKNLEDDIALSLSALGIRIIAPMPGRGTIGIEVPNQKPEIVSMRSVISSAKFQDSKFELPIALGKTISNETYVVDLTKMPHLLVAGATGQGKSVGLNAILTSLIYKKHPSQVKFVLVDPKKVELTLYEKIERHFLAKLPDMEDAIITDNKQVIQTLSSLGIEMTNRYNLLKAAQVRNIKEYNDKFIARRLNPEKGHRYLPYIVVVIDEFADLIMTAGKEVELPLARLAQLSRAIGIHLIVATQRPSTNIITGVIKANFPTRIAFKVPSMIDSRTILDTPGANQLIGRGDMLITQGSDLIRLQCAFIDTDELEKITDFIGSQQGYPDAMLLPEPELDTVASETMEADNGKRDDLFADAARMIVIHQQGSTSLIQRKLAIGYNRAGRIMDQLERAGIVGPFEGSKARQVLYTDEYSLEQFLNTLG